MIISLFKKIKEIRETSSRINQKLKEAENNLERSKENLERMNERD